MTGSHDLTLWGVGTSRTERAHWAMQELGLSYVTRPKRVMQRPGYQRGKAANVSPAPNEPLAHHA